MHVLQLDREAVRGISLSQGETTLKFSKHRDDKTGLETWRLAAPEDAAVQSAKVAGLLYKIWNLKADRVLREKPSSEDLHKHGLESPSLRVDLSDAQGAPLGSLLLGSIDGDWRSVSTDKAARIDAVAKSAVEDISVQISDYKEEATSAKD